MSFNFPNTSQNSSNAGGASAPSGSSIFGSGGTPNLFGGGQSNSGPGAAGPATTGTAGTASSTSAFGAASAFGAKPAGTSAFGGLGTSGTNGSSIFGGTATGASQPAVGGGLFGGGTAAGSSNPSGNTFGSSAAPTTAPTPGAAPAGAGFFGAASTGTGSGGAAPNNLFGSAPGASMPAPGGGLFSTAKPATEPPKPTTGLFGPALTTTAAAAPPASAGLFGSAAKPAEGAPAPAPAAPAAGGSLFGGSNLFGKKPETPAPAPTASPAPGSAPATTAAPAASAFSAFSLGGSNNATASKDAAPAAATGGLFGNLGASKPAENKEAAPAAAPTTGLFGTTKPAETKPAPAASTFSLSTGEKPKDGAVAAVSVPPPSVLRGKSIEEIVNKWSSDLDNHVRDFNTFASEVAAWDRALIGNGNNLAALYNMVLAAEREQSDIDMALDHIEQQQRDLSSTLEVYEKSAEEVLGGQGGSLRALDTGPADTERDKNYVLATELHSHLEDLSGSLTQMIDSVNAISPGVQGDTTRSAEDPMGQIVQILSTHLESLQWIDGAVRDIEGKVGEVEKRVREAGGANNSGYGGGQSRSRGFGMR